MSPAHAECGTPAERIRIMHDSPVLVETHLAFRQSGDLQFANVSATWASIKKA